MNQKHQKEKTQFQIERIAFFSDAVIAIAVTLLIIEIKAPHIELGAGFNEQVHQLAHLFPEFIAFVISFAIIISQWTKHHELFGNVINYDKKLIGLNSMFLFSTALIPFSTSYFATNSVQTFFLPYIVYGFNLFIMSILNYLVFKHVMNEKNNLFDGSLTKTQIKWLSIDHLHFPAAILLGLTFGFINFNLGIVAYVMVALLGIIIQKKLKKHK